MAEKIECYGIKSKFGIFQIEEISFEDLGKSGYDYQIAFKTLSNYNGNASFELVLVKDGEEVDCLEMGGWKFQKFTSRYDWGNTWFESEVTDCIGETRKMVLSSGRGQTSQYWEPNEKHLYRMFNEMKRISTFGSFKMLELCSYDDFLKNPTSLYDCYLRLEHVSTCCKKAYDIRERLLKNPEDKDIKAYNDILKPKLIKYMEQISSMKIKPEMFDLKASE